MSLRGQDAERGYSMAALLVALAVMSVLMTVAMPVWRTQTTREKEAELVFRGEQYARAIALYRAKNGNNFPPSIDALVQGKFLRKKYKDPMTESGEFQTIMVGGQAGQQNTDGGRGQGRGQGRGAGQIPPPFVAAAGGFATGAIMGVRSKSTESSMRIYRGQTRYDMWQFTFQVVNRPGGNQPGAGAPGVGGPGRGRGGQPGIGPGGGRGPGRGRGPEGGRGRGFGPGRGQSILPGGRGPGQTPQILRPPGG